jgi:hypothetical protein
MTEQKLEEKMADAMAWMRMNMPYRYLVAVRAHIEAKTKEFDEIERLRKENEALRELLKPYEPIYKLQNDPRMSQSTSFYSPVPYVPSEPATIPRIVSFFADTRNDAGKRSSCCNKTVLVRCAGCPYKEKEIGNKT